MDAQPYWGRNRRLRRPSKAAACRTAAAATGHPQRATAAPFAQRHSAAPSLLDMPPASIIRDRSQPIWVSLSQGRAELYREILEVQYGSSPYLEK